MAMRTPCCHSFLAFIIKFLNFLQTFVGISLILYSVYLLNQWNKHPFSPHQHPAPAPFKPDAGPSNFQNLGFPDRVSLLKLAAGQLSGLDDGLKLNSVELPAPWFIYASMGLGIVLCCISCIGHIAAEVINGCCLCFYTLLAAVLILLEGALVAFIAIDRHWEKDIPYDPTGDVDNIRSFIEDNADILKWVGFAIVIIQVLSLLLSLVLRSMVSTQTVDDDIEGDYDVRVRTREPLLNPQVSQPSGSVKGDSDIWSSRMREKTVRSESIGIPIMIYCLQKKRVQLQVPFLLGACLDYTICSLGNIAPENAEAIGVREALSWIKEQQVRDVLVETDCLVVVQAIRSSGVPLSYFGRLIEECRMLLSELRDRNVIVKFVKRSANMVAHFLAKSTNSIADRIWRVCDNHPGFIDVLMNDLIHE